MRWCLRKYTKMDKRLWNICPRQETDKESQLHNNQKTCDTTSLRKDLTRRWPANYNWWKMFSAGLCDTAEELLEAVFSVLYHKGQLLLEESSLWLQSCRVRSMRSSAGMWESHQLGRTQVWKQQTLLLNSWWTRLSSYCSELQIVWNNNSFL